MESFADPPQAPSPALAAAAAEAGERDTPTSPPQADKKGRRLVRRFKKSWSPSPPSPHAPAARRSSCSSSNPGGAFPCGDCGTSLSSQSSLESHRESFHLSVRCDRCDQVFKGRFKLKKHAHKAHPERGASDAGDGEGDGAVSEVFVCHICGKGLAKSATLASHFKSFHELQKCQFCDEQLTAMSMPRHLMKMHNSASGTHPVAKCPFCAKVISKRQIPVHVKIFHEMIPCVICGQELAGQKAFKQHRAAVHGDVDKREFVAASNRTRFKYHCLQCNYSCLARRGLRDHRLQHHPESMTEEERREKVARYVSDRPAASPPSTAVATNDSLADDHSRAIAEAVFEYEDDVESGGQTPARLVIDDGQINVKEEPAQAAVEEVDDNFMRLIRAPLDAWPEAEMDPLQQHGQQLTMQNQPLEMSDYMTLEMAQHATVPHAGQSFTEPYWMPHQDHLYSAASPPLFQDQHFQAFATPLYSAYSPIPQFLQDPRREAGEIFQANEVGYAHEEVVYVVPQH